jgi:hypothetical protein
MQHAPERIVLAKIFNLINCFLGEAKYYGVMVTATRVLSPERVTADATTVKPSWDPFPVQREDSPETFSFGRQSPVTTSAAFGATAASDSAVTVLTSYTCVELGQGLSIPKHVRLAGCLDSSTFTQSDFGDKEDSTASRRALAEALPIN